MKHFVEFRQDATFALERKGLTSTCRLERGAQRPANVRCYVVCRNERYVEVADVEVKEGTLRGIPCTHFMFIDLMDGGHFPGRRTGE
jgi:hypothetical protein